MKKTYLTPKFDIYLMSSKTLFVSTSAPSDDVDDSDKSNKFDSSSKSLLWEDDDMETENKE